MKDLMFKRDKKVVELLKKYETLKALKQQRLEFGIAIRSTLESASGDTSIIFVGRIRF
jgi:hypothetical protein